MSFLAGTERCGKKAHLLDWCHASVGWRAHNCGIVTGAMCASCSLSVKK